MVEVALLVPSLPLVHPHRQPLVQHQAQPLVKALEGLVLQLLLLVKVEEVSFVSAAICIGNYTIVCSQKSLFVQQNISTLLAGVRADCNKTRSVVFIRQPLH